MADAKKNPASARDKKPQNQADEEHGSVKGAQVTEETMRRRSDTPRGSEPETRAAASNRS
jgi:hypothetical protein